jgi:glycosyltransferase involved in cell wall biosynthesis
MIAPHDSRHGVIVIDAWPTKKGRLRAHHRSARMVSSAAHARVRVTAMSLSVSVLLCTRNRPAKLHRAVDSILANLYRDFELVVVDQSTDEASRAKVESFVDPRIVYIQTDTVGLSRARNIAIRAARSSIIVFTDDDCVCDSEWLSSIVAEYRRDRSVMGVFGRVVAYGDPVPGMFCPCLIEALDRRVVDTPVVPQRALGAGNNMSFKKDVFHQVGLFIESLGAGTRMKSGEDTEFVYRALRQRMKFVYAPDALVHHDNWSSEAQYPALARSYILGGAAVFTKFALHMDAIAFTELARTGYYILRNRLGAGSIPTALGDFLIGCASGVGYFLASPPKLPAYADGAGRD